MRVSLLLGRLRYTQETDDDIFLIGMCVALALNVVSQARSDTEYLLSRLRGRGGVSQGM